MITLVQMTVYMTVTATILLLFKRVFKEKLSAKWQVWIWAFLLIRFLVPSLPQSDVSVFNAVPQTVIYMEELPRMEENTEAPDVADGVETTTDNHQKSVSTSDVVVPIWICGAVLMFVYFTATHFAYRRELSRGCLCDEFQCKNSWGR